VAGQLRDGDGLQVVCDGESDPVVDNGPPVGVEIPVVNESVRATNADDLHAVVASLEEELATSEK
jgi:hypothetical protein